MKLSVWFGIFLVTALSTLVFVEPAIAGPGGKIAKAAFESVWGRIVLGALVLLFAPLIVWSMFREKRAVRRAQKDLAYVALSAEAFEWLSLRERVINCFHRIHGAWSRHDVGEAAQFMTDWYWQNQQLVFLDQWAANGLVNHCSVKSIRTIKPLLFQHVNRGSPHEGSTVVISITAHMQDYLLRENTQEIVEGSEKWKDVTTLWTFVLNEGQWRVSNIDESEQVDEYLELTRQLPKIADTMESASIRS